MVCTTNEGAMTQAPYLLIEDDESPAKASASTDYHEKALAGIESTLADLQTTMLSVAIIFMSMSGLMLYSSYYESLDREDQERVGEIAMLVSIPIVALFFTWFHIWLAIQMMFRPINFIGLWEFDHGIGVGWQGVVPRKCLKMAKMAFACARMYLLGPRDWLGRVDPNVLMAKTKPMLTRIIQATITSVGKRHFPSMLEKGRLPPLVQEELVATTIENIQADFPSLWREITEILCDPKIGIDNDGMIVTVFSQNKALLNHFFMSLGAREFRFIERCGAALGFICGCVQLFAFQRLDATGRAIFLPLTGFFLGIITNWLAIQMCFRPCFPIPVRVCGRQVYTIQGLFLKRQKDVSILYSKMLCDHFFEFNKVMDYLQTLPELWGKLKEVYLAHVDRVMKRTMGGTVNFLAPYALGSKAYSALEADLLTGTAERIGEAADLHEVASRYIAVATDVFRSNAIAMQTMPPNEFENLLHPVFQEDEWILILLGGILGAIVGLAQVHFLSA